MPLFVSKLHQGTVKLRRRHSLRSGTCPSQVAGTGKRHHPLQAAQSVRVDIKFRVRKEVGGVPSSDSQGQFVSDGVCGSLSTVIVEKRPRSHGENREKPALAKIAGKSKSNVVCNPHTASVILVAHTDHEWKHANVELCRINQILPRQRRDLRATIQEPEFWISETTQL